MPDTTSVNGGAGASPLRAADLPPGTSAGIYEFDHQSADGDGMGSLSPRIRECVDYASRMGWNYRMSVDVAKHAPLPERFALERLLHAMKGMVARRASPEVPAALRSRVVLLVHDEKQLGDAPEAVAMVEERLLHIGAYLVVLTRLPDHATVCGVGAR